MTIQSRRDFLEARQSGLGGSDIAAILGMSRWGTPYSVYRSKVEPIPDEDTEEREYLYWGNVLEDVVAKEYAKRTGYKVQRVNVQMQHPDHPFMQANIDRAVINPQIAGNVRWKDGRLTTDRVLECKTANAFAAKDWGDVGSDEVPDYYLIQCQWYLGITQAEVADLAVLIGGSDYRHFSIIRNDTLIADLQEEAAAFWGRVESLTPPDPSTVDDALHRWPRHLHDKTEIVGVETFNAACDLHAVKEQMKELKKREDALKLDLMRAAGDAEVLTHGGEKIATWKAQTANRIDTKALKADHPDIAALYTKTSESRVLRLTSAVSKKESSQ